MAPVSAATTCCPESGGAARAGFGALPGHLAEPAPGERLLQGLDHPAAGDRRTGHRQRHRLDVGSCGVGPGERAGDHQAGCRDHGAGADAGASAGRSGSRVSAEPGRTGRRRAAHAPCRVPGCPGRSTARSQGGGSPRASTGVSRSAASEPEAALFGHAHERALRAAPPAPQAEEGADQNRLGVGRRVVGAGHPVPVHVHPAEGFLNQVLGEMRVAGREDVRRAVGRLRPGGHELQVSPTPRPVGGGPGPARGPRPAPGDTEPRNAPWEQARPAVPRPGRVTRPGPPASPGPSIPGPTGPVRTAPRPRSAAARPR